MKLTHSLAQFQKEHVVMELECIDRMYLNAYVPKLTSAGGMAAFCRGYLGHRFASTKQAVQMTTAFVKSIEAFIQREGLELVVSDKKEFSLPLAELKATDKRAKNCQLLDDYSVWFVNNR